MLNIVLMHHQKSKKKKSKKISKKPTHNNSRSEYYGYQKDNPLTEYVERVMGINCTSRTKD